MFTSGSESVVWNISLQRYSTLAMVMGCIICWFVEWSTTWESEAAQPGLAYWSLSNLYKIVFQVGSMCAAAVPTQTTCRLLLLLGEILDSYMHMWGTHVCACQCIPKCSCMSALAAHTVKGKHIGHRPWQKLKFKIGTIGINVCKGIHDFILIVGCIISTS